MVRYMLALPGDRREPQRKATHIGSSSLHCAPISQTQWEAPAGNQQCAGKRGGQVESSQGRESTGVHWESSVSAGA